MNFDGLDFEGPPLFDLLLELTEHEPERFHYLGKRNETEFRTHKFGIRTETFGEVTPFEVHIDDEGGEVTDLYELGMLGILMELCCQERAWDIQMIMSGRDEALRYEFTIWDGTRNILGSGSDASKEPAFLQAYLKALSSGE